MKSLSLNKSMSLINKALIFFGENSYIGSSEGDVFIKECIRKSAESLKINLDSILPGEYPYTIKGDDGRLSFGKTYWKYLNRKQQAEYLRNWQRRLWDSYTKRTTRRICMLFVVALVLSLLLTISIL